MCPICCEEKEFYCTSQIVPPRWVGQRVSDLGQRTDLTIVCKTCHWPIRALWGAS